MTESSLAIFVRADSEAAKRRALGKRPSGPPAPCGPNHPFAVGMFVIFSCERSKLSPVAALSFFEPRPFYGIGTLGASRSFLALDSMICLPTLASASLINSLTLIPSLFANSSRSCKL